MLLGPGATAAGSAARTPPSPDQVQPVATRYESRHSRPSVPSTKTSRLPAASETAEGDPASWPPSGSHPCQKPASSQSCQSPRSEDRTKTSSRPAPQEATDAFEVGDPPRDSQCQAPSK